MSIEDKNNKKDTICDYFSIGDIITKYSSCIEDAMSQMSMVQSQIDKYMKDNEPIFNKLAEDLQKLNDSISIDLRDTISRVILYKKHKDEFKNFEYSFAGFLPHSEMVYVYKKWKNGDEIEVRNFFNNKFENSEYLDKIIEIFKSNKYFQPRINILKDAFYAHCDKKYTLSIPVFLSQIDGIFLKSLGHVLEGKLETCPQCKKTTIMPNAKSISEYLLKTEENKIYEYLLLYTINTYKIRNKILHGIKTDYDNQDFSTKLIMALFELNLETNGI